MCVLSDYAYVSFSPSGIFTYFKMSEFCLCRFDMARTLLKLQSRFMADLKIYLSIYGLKSFVTVSEI